MDQGVGGREKKDQNILVNWLFSEVPLSNKMVWNDFKTGYNCSKNEIKYCWIPIIVNVFNLFWLMLFLRQCAFLRHWAYCQSNIVKISLVLNAEYLIVNVVLSSFFNFGHFAILFTTHISVLMVILFPHNFFEIILVS